MGAPYFAAEAAAAAAVVVVVMSGTCLAVEKTRCIQTFRMEGLMTVMMKTTRV